MRNRFAGSLVGVAIAAAAVSAIITVSMTRTIGQASRPARTSDGKPNLNGVWQANNEANWDLQAHQARPGAVTQPGVYPYPFPQVPAAPVLALGAAAGVPGSLGVVLGDGQIPYKPEAAAKKQENVAHWIDRDPELKCYLPGIPRATYMPYPFQIVQSTNKIQMAYTFTNAARTIHLDKVTGPPDDTWMGHSVGHWEGDTLVVDVTQFNDKTWFDRAGNFHSDVLHVVERFTPISPDAFRYEVHRRSENVHGAMEDRDAHLSPSGAEYSAPRLPMHRVCGRIPVRQPSQTATGQALGKRYDRHRHQAQGSARRSPV